MQTGAITGYFDVAQVALYAFWLFFAGLVFYLRREDKREGYPLVSDTAGERQIGFPQLPKPKTFLLKSGETILAPRPDETEPPLNAEPTAAWPGAPLYPVGNPMLAGAGPAAWALRADIPDKLQELDENRIVPIRRAEDHFLDEESPDPRGKEVVGADGIVAGTVSDIWIDRAETAARYLEVTIGTGASVMVPTALAKVTSTGRVIVSSIMAAQFADAPALASPDQITLREEDRIQAYFASGHLYARPSRTEPLL